MKLTSAEQLFARFKVGMFIVMTDLTSDFECLPIVYPHLVHLYWNLVLML